MEGETNILDLPPEVWGPIIQYLSFDDLYNCSLVCKTFLKNLRYGKTTKIDLSQNGDINLKFLLNEILSKQCTFINLNHCYWMDPNIILEILAKTKLKELHVVECDMNDSVINFICSLNLTSLSLSFNCHWLRSLGQKDTFAPCFPALKNLKVFCPVTNSSSLLNCLYNLCQKLLPHCKTLEHFIVYTDPHQTVSPSPDFYGLELLDKFNNLCKESTPVPKLKSLIVNLADCCILHIQAFLKVIFNKKIIPLEHVYFGKHSNRLIMLPSFTTILPLIKMSSTFCLSSSHKSLALNILTNQSTWQQVKDVQLFLNNQTNYKRYIMENLVFDNLLVIAAIISKNSAKTVEEINFHGSIINSKFSLGFELITRYCKNLTVLNLSVQNWTENNENVLNMLSKLSNLQALHLSSFALGVREECNSNSGNAMPIERKIPIFSLWKVTANCKQLKEIRIAHVGPVRNPFSIIHEDTLSHIKHCKNLQELHLVRFYTSGLKSALPKIVKKCNKLQTLYLTDIINLEKRNHRISFLSRCLKHAKSIKYLSLKQFCEMSVSFVEALSCCKNLEKLYLDNLLFEPSVCQSLEKHLPKMQKLCMFYLCNYNNTEHDGILHETLKRMKITKPAFYFKLQSSGENNFDEIPITHLHMLQYVPKII